MKKLLALLLSVLCLFGAASALAEGGYANRLEKILGEGRLVLGTEPEYSPYEFVDETKTGQAAIVGADISLAYYIAEQLGVELVIEAMGFDAISDAIRTGTIDLALSGIEARGESSGAMVFTAVYYDAGDQVVLVRAEDLDTYNTLAAFAGQTVIAQNGTLQMEMLLTKLDGATQAAVEVVPVGVMLVYTGMVDGMVLPAAVAERYVANYPELAICPQTFAHKSTGLAGALPRNEAELQNRVNEIIQMVVDKGLYFTWMDEAVELMLIQMQ